MNPKIEFKPAMHFIGISDTFISVHSSEATNATVIPALWDRFPEVIEQVSEPVDRCCYGVIFPTDEPTHPDEYHYIAALQVPSPQPTCRSMVTYSSSASTHAMVEHRGPIAKIGNTLRTFEEWLDASDYARAGGAEIEAYPDAYNPNGEQSVMETWIPVALKSER